MTTALEPVKSDRKQSSEFLAALFGRYFEDHDGWVELRFISPKKGTAPELRWIRQGKLDADGWAEVKRGNKDRQVFVGVNPRTFQKGCAVDIESVVCLWADVDGKEEGKEAALNRVKAFPIKPSILVDSGHGYHCYWLLRRPLLEITDDIRLEVRQILKGFNTKSPLKSDSQRTDISSCLRLPGTMNIKLGMEPVRCSLIECHPDVTFTLADFTTYRDDSFREPEGSDEEMPVFGEREVIVSSKLEEGLEPEEARAKAEAKAFEKVDELDIPKRTHDMIITGKGIGLKDNKDRSRRDESIICSLIWARYGYATIKSIFFCPFLKCSDRIREQGEARLKWDVKKALKSYEKFKLHGTTQSNFILAIKKNPYLVGPEKLAKIKEYVVADLLTGPTPMGEGFYEDESGPYYFFHTEERTLIDLDSGEFGYFIESRFVTDRNDAAEILRALKAAVYASKKKVTPYMAHYYDEEKGVLYLDDGANGVYRVDRQEIKLQNNGDEGVFFKECKDLFPLEYLPGEKVINYFRDDPPPEYARFGPTPTVPLGLSLEKFYSEGSYLNEFLISRASFATLEENNISPEEQKLLLIIYFYTLFFEEIFIEKPVASFIGKLQSGKSFIATSIGKLIFGPGFEKTSFPDTDDSLKTIFAEERYVVLDDVKKIPPDMKSTLDSYSTGRPKIGKREPYKKTLQRGVPRCFFAITALEMKGWDDSFMRRVLLFNTKALTKVTEPPILWRPLLEKRNKIMTEVLVNLQSIVAMLWSYREFDPENPLNITATWSSFGQKITSWFGSRLMFRKTIAKMVRKKQETLLDDDPLWWVLQYCLFERRTEPGVEEGGEDIDQPMTTAALHQFLFARADDMKILREFKYRYESARTLGMRLVSIKEELAKRIEVEETPWHSNLKRWTFRKKQKEQVTIEPERKEKEDKKWDAIAKATALGPNWVPSGIDPMDDEATIMKKLGVTEWTEEDLKVLEEELKKKG